MKPVVIATCLALCGWLSPGTSHADDANRVADYFVTNMSLDALNGMIFETYETQISALL